MAQTKSAKGITSHEGPGARLNSITYTRNVAAINTYPKRRYGSAVFFVD